MESPLLIGVREIAGFIRKSESWTSLWIKKIELRQDAEEWQQKIFFRYRKPCPWGKRVTYRDVPAADVLVLREFLMREGLTDSFPKPCIRCINGRFDNKKCPNRQCKIYKK